MPELISALTSKLRFVLAASLVAVLMPAQAGFEEDYEKQAWQEIQFQIPVAPKNESLIPFYVSVATDNRFFVDGSSVSVGSDGVVRFVLLVLTSGGARNVTFDGMRCETGERRIYASGRSDGSWSKSRRNDWEKIKDAVANRHYAVLFYEYFCPGGIVARSDQEAVGALRAGVHPDNRRW